MKTFKTLLATASVAMALIGQASADVTFYATGSTAFRAATNNALKDMFVQTGSAPIYKYSGSSLASSTNIWIQGTIPGQPGLGTVTVIATWSGSNDAIERLSTNNTTTNYYADGTSAAFGGASVSSGISSSGHVIDMILMDTSQALTPYNINPINDTTVIGVLPFTWVASKDAPAGVNNMTAQIARAMFNVGYASASAFSGNPADAPVTNDGLTAVNTPGASTVFMAGRDTGSGTRNSTLAETSYGASNGAVIQLGVLATFSIPSVTAGSFTFGVDASDQGGVDASLIGKAVSGTSIQSAASTFSGNATLTSGAATSGSPIITVTSTAGVIAGTAITGTGIPSGTTVSSITNGTTLVLSVNATSTGSGRTFTLVDLSKGATTNGSAIVTVLRAPAANVVAGMAISGTGIPTGTTILTVNSPTQLTLSANATATNTNRTFTVTPAVTGQNGTSLTLSNAATTTATNGSFQVGTIVNNTVTSLFYTYNLGQQGQNSGGTLADTLRYSTNGATEPIGLQVGSNYGTNSCLVSYMGLADADRAVNGTSSSVSAGNNVGCKYMSYEGVSCTGGVLLSAIVASQAAATTSLTVSSTTGLVVGQLVSGNGITPGTTVSAIPNATTITLSKATQNAGILTNNVVTVQQFLPDAVRSGKYSFWSYERVGHRQPLTGPGTPTNSTLIRDAFVLQVKASSTDLGASSGIPNDDDMRVSRSEVGQPIGLKL